MPNPDTHTLTRTGDVPLTFSGSLIARASSQQPPTKKGRSELETHWHELALYLTTAGTHVAHISYRSTWPGELDDHCARAGTLSDCVGWLRDYDPTGPVKGFPLPHGPSFAARHAALLQQVEHGFDSALSQLLTGLGISETVD